mmetsp:Transcript_17636/g.53361  ORF Transcript_17636/g.53361 Transcript_17636/m.53361 type:complete len:109 (-) Transcript_17636:241-567(-)|eukprot:scaffold26396_cov33-Tisochrysis_lutea.AAC.1
MDRPVPELTTSYIEADRKLASARMAAQRSIGLSEGVMTLLESQRERLLAASNGLDATGQSLTRGQGLMSGILQRATRRKFTVIAIATALAFIVLLLLYFKLRRAFGSG